MAGYGQSGTWSIRYLNISVHIVLYIDYRSLIYLFLMCARVYRTLEGSPSPGHSNTSSHMVVEYTYWRKSFLEN